MTSQSEREPRHAATVERVYGNDEIEVTWEPSFCIHFAACLRGSPLAFDTQRRPWIDVDAEPPERIVEIVEQCPTGALHARWMDGRQRDGADKAVDVEVRRNGPLFLRGPVQIVDRSGAVLREDTRVALCRCGASGNKPFCDGSHLRIRFKG